MKRFTRYAAMTSAAFLAIAIVVSAQERRDQARPAQANPLGQQNAQQVQQQNQQQFNQQQRPQAGQQIQGQAAWQQHGDQQLATWLINDNEGEVAIAQFVAGKTQNASIKEFAQDMIHDHNEFLKKLHQFAPSASVTTTDQFAPQSQTQTRTESTRQVNQAERTNQNEDRANQNRSNANANNGQGAQQRTQANQQQNVGAARQGQVTTTQQGTTLQQQGAVAQQGAMGPVDLLRIKQEIGRECVATFKKELGSKRSDEFDKCYIGQQIGAHFGMADTLKVMKNHASPQLRNVIAEGEKVAEEHLEHAKQLMKELEGEKRTERTASKQDRESTKD